MLKALATWLVAINLVTYLIYAWDKRRAAKGQRRISERELLLWALAGGSPAAFLAMRRQAVIPKSRFLLLLDSKAFQK